MVNGKALIVGLVVFLCFTPLSLRASKLDLGSADARFEQSERVVVATVVRVSADRQKATLRILATLKGTPVKRISFLEHPLVTGLSKNLQNESANSGCQCFVKGQSFVFMLVESKEKGLYQPTSAVASVVRIDR
jgi:hypothetical protein